MFPSVCLSASKNKNKKKKNICKSVCVKVENLIAVACSGVISVPTAR